MSYETLQTIFQLITASGTLLAGLGGLEAYKKSLKIINKFSLSGALLLTIGGIGTYFIGQKIQQEQDAKQAYVGKLEPKNKVLLSATQDIWPKLEIGNSGAILLFTGNKGEPIFEIGKDNGITIEVENGQVKISTIIRDKNGYIVAQIIKNEWKVNPNSSWDRNYSKNAFEVRDLNGDVVLQVRLVEDRIQFQGKLYDSNGQGIVFRNFGGPGEGGIIEPSDPKLNSQIAPLFKYPSDLHLGEFL